MMLEYIINLDKKLFELINSHWTSAWGDVFFPFITDLHKDPVYKWILLAVIIMSFILRRGLKKGSLLFVMAAISVFTADGVGNYGFKKTVQRPRPAQTENLTVRTKAPSGGYSFVSNHSTNVFSFATFTSVIFPAAALPLYSIAALVAYSRVYNGVHFPADVIIGGLLGSLIGLIFAKIYLQMQRHLPRKKRTSA